VRAERLRFLTLLVGVAASLGCAVNLDPDPPRVRPALAADALDGCLPLRDRVDSLEGRLGLLELYAGRSVLIAASARFDGKAVASGFAVDNGSLDGCATGLEPVQARPLLDLSGLGGSRVGRPLGGVSAGVPYLFFAADSGVDFRTDGYGVARWDPKAERFVAVSLLWTGDRPSYGSAAVVDGDHVYVFGGIAARFLSADAYVARAPVNELTEPAAYEYWAGGGSWSPNPDEAMPLVEAGTSPSVIHDTEHTRWLMAYTSPLSDAITVRSGLGVTGPWSQPFTLGRCDLPSVDDGAFCGDVTLVPTWAPSGGIALTQAVASFGRPEGATASDYWTRLISVGWPVGLP
jgi:hypothetical protein